MGEFERDYKTELEETEFELGGANDIAEQSLPKDYNDVHHENMAPAAEEHEPDYDEAGKKMRKAKKTKASKKKKAKPKKKHAAKKKAKTKKKPAKRAAKKKKAKHAGKRKKAAKRKAKPKRKR